jgi:eukaryotic-like serine/threonine-protein kinase
MSSERWERIKEILEQALPMSSERREAYLDSACGSDAQMRAEVESLIAHHEQAGSQFLGDAAPDVLQLTTPLASPEARVGLAVALAPQFVGPYRLLRRLGEGGMGQVWLAEQTEPVQRMVAVKLIKIGMYDNELLQRFRLERQSLAMMDHPAIAKVFDAGATPGGQPYFVMEYVPGIPITQYCDEKRLTVKQRLELFIKVCEGVQHAHQKAIIHRDLKPANILVADVDSKPMPRIIDFGLAKATDRIGDETVMTRLGGFVGTLGYMSPEQADSTVRDVDTRSDVYSLGVVLYVLLTGNPPFDSSQWKNQSFDEVLRHLREVDPPRPSAKVRIETRLSASSAELRGLELRQLETLLHGDLDWIAMKALEKDRARRYGTPMEMAADISRYLANEPIVARPASTAYRLRKYVRRHRVGVVMAAMLVVLLAGFALLQAVQVRRVTRERDHATRERDRANLVTDFMTGMFKVSNPSEARGNTITAREVLDKASKDIDTGLAKDPELQAQMMDVMGNVYRNLGLYSKAELLLTGELKIRRALGSKRADTFRSMNNLGAVLLDEGRYPESEKLLREALDGRGRVLGPEHLETLTSMNNLAAVLSVEGRYADAEELHQQTLNIQRRVLGPEHPDTLLSMSNIGELLATEGRYPEAEKIERQAVDIQRRVLGPENMDTLRSMHTLAAALSNQGRYADAVQLDRETLEIARRVLGPEHSLVLGTMNNLADSLKYEGRDTEAKQLLLTTRDIQRRALGPEHPDTAISTYNLACIAARGGHVNEAFSLLRNAIDHGLPVYGDLGIDKDPDLKLLHGDPRFAGLVAHAKEKAPAAQKQN